MTTVGLETWYSASLNKPKSKEMVVGRSPVHKEILCCWNEAKERWERIDGMPIKIYAWKQIKDSKLVPSPKCDWEKLKKKNNE